MLLEPQRPEECDTTKTASLQKKTNSKLKKKKPQGKNENCDLLYAVFSVKVFLGFVLFVSVFSRGFVAAAVGRQKRKKDFGCFVDCRRF